MTEQTARQIERMNGDRFVRETVGGEVVEASPGYAKVKLEIEPRHLNGVGIAQGGVLFTLADYAFATATNYGDAPVVGIEASISYIKSVQHGTIYATAKEVGRTAKLASCRVDVTDEAGKLLAIFTGRGYVLTQR